MKINFLLSILLLISFGNITLANSPEQKNIVRSKILANVCWTTPNHPVCKPSANSNEESFLPLAPRLTPDDVLEVFTGVEQIEKNFFAISTVLSGKVDVQPWSGHYWPIYQGGISARSFDPNFPASEDYLKNKEYMEKELKDFDPAKVNTKILSPAEKYDLIAHDTEFSLTRAVLNEGQLYQNEHNKVETWMGICHGWAPAAFILPRPSKSVLVSSPILVGNTETSIEFKPDDIKALGSQLWAKSQFPTAFVGARCNEKDPKMDRDGHILDTDCFDTDPAAFHLLMIEMVAKQKRSFVLDVTYNYEVWNQPVVAFNIKYQNPRTLKYHDKIEDNITSIKKYKKDRFRKYRTSEVTQIINVTMEVVYLGETSPSEEVLDTPDYDNLISAFFNYDLELNDLGEIVGGEWHQAEHPDFIWAPINSKNAESPFDRWLRIDWNPEVPVPPIYTHFSQGSGKIGFPLGKIINPLFEASRSK